MKEKDKTMKKSSTAARKIGGMALTALVAFSLVAGLLLLVRLQAQAQTGPEAVEAELSVTKTANTDVAAPGDQLTYTINIQKLGADLTPAWLTDSLPVELDYVAGSFVAADELGSTIGTFDVIDDVITWHEPNLAGPVWITFTAQILPNIEGEVDNTVQVTGTGELMTDVWTTNVVSGLLRSQIRSPNRNAFITKKGTQTIEGIAWREGADVPYLTEDITLSLEPIPGDEWSYWVRWTQVPAAGGYILQESTDRDFLVPTQIPSEDASELRAKSLGDEDTYYYRVRAIAASSEVTPSRWSNVASVTVPWDRSMSASLSAVAAAGAADSATVEVRTGEAGSSEWSEWQAAEVTAETWDGWTWSYEWDLPELESTQYVIQSRASEDGESFGEPDTITVTLNNKNYFVYLTRVFKRWPPVPKDPFLEQISNPDRWVNYRVSWSYDHVDPDVPNPTSYTLQESKDPSFDNPTTYGPVSDTYYDVSDPGRQKSGGTYYYRVRGRNSYGPGEWSNIRSTAIRVLPYAPTLSVYDPNKDGDITVNWTYGHDYPPATSYVLWEAEDATFDDPEVFEVAGTSKERGDRPDGTCYKVRAKNDYGEGDWSNTVCIEVETAFRDDFDDPDSGWEARRTSAPDIDDDTEVKYRNGRLRTRSEDNWDFAIFSPMVDAPPMPYKISMKSRLREGVDAPGYGIVFRGNRGDFCRVERDDAEDDDGCFSEYFRLNITIDPGQHIRYSVKRIKDHDERGRAEGKDLSDGYDDIDDVADWEEWNTWEVEVYKEYFKIYVNDEHLGTWYDDSYRGNRQFGILTSAYEYAPSEFEHEYFYVEPID